MYFRVYASQLQHVKDVKTLPECETDIEKETEKGQDRIATAKIFKNEIFEIHDESGLISGLINKRDTIVNKDNSQSSNNNIQNIPKNDISDSAYPIKTNVNFAKINDKIVYINPTKNTFLPVAFPAQLITTTSHVCLIQHT